MSSPDEGPCRTGAASRDCGLIVHPIGKSALRTGNLQEVLRILLRLRSRLRFPLLSVTFRVPPPLFGHFPKCPQLLQIQRFPAGLRACGFSFASHRDLKRAFASRVVPSFGYRRELVVGHPQEALA